MLLSPPFPIQAFPPDGPVPDSVLTVFIEGDGDAFTRRHSGGPMVPSNDPTPSNPIGLDLAVAERRLGGAAAYLA